MGAGQQRLRRATSRTIRRGVARPRRARPLGRRLRWRRGALPRRECRRGRTGPRLRRRRRACFRSRRAGRGWEVGQPDIVFGRAPAAAGEIGMGIAVLRICALSLKLKYVVVSPGAHTTIPQFRYIQEKWN